MNGPQWNEYLQILRSVEGSQEQIQLLKHLACGMQFLLKHM